MLSSTVEVAVKAVGVAVLGGVAIVAAGRWVERQLDSRLAILRADHEEIREEMPAVWPEEREAVGGGATSEDARGMLREAMATGIAIGRELPPDKAE